MRILEMQTVEHCSILYLLFVIERSANTGFIFCIAQECIYFQGFTTPKTKFTISFYFVLLLILCYYLLVYYHSQL